MRNIAERKKCMNLKEAEGEEVVLEAAQTDGTDLLKGDVYFLSLAQLQHQR